jgi:hypothetical protein
MHIGMGALDTQRAGCTFPVEPVEKQERDQLLGGHRAVNSVEYRLKMLPG